MYSINFKEKDLVILLTRSDEASFEELYHLYSPRLLGYLITLVKSETFAGELLQDTFIKLWDNRENIDPNQSFRSYLFRIAENIVYDFFRKAARDKKLQAQFINSASRHYSHVEENICSREDVQILHEVIDLLPPRRRQIYELVKIEERSYEEVSRLMKISISTISDHIVKANKFILKRLSTSEITTIIFFILFLL